MKNSKYGAIKFQCFTQEQVKIINEKIKENIIQKEDSSFVAGKLKKGEFSHAHCATLMEWLHPWLYQCQQANREIFGYDIYWDFHLEGLTYNVYGKNGEYGWHIDADSEKPTMDMKLTCLLNLSEETYEGGDFYMINSEKNIKFTIGMGLVLNSLVAHKVTPVTKGERITLTYWGNGPAWR